MSGMKINHHCTFTGPGFVPTSTDETSARETTGGTAADVGITPVDLPVMVPDKSQVPDINLRTIES